MHLPTCTVRSEKDLSIPLIVSLNPSEICADSVTDDFINLATIHF